MELSIAQGRSYSRQGALVEVFAGIVCRFPIEAVDQATMGEPIATPRLFNLAFGDGPGDLMEHQMKMRKAIFVSLGHEQISKLRTRLFAKPLKP